MARPRSEDKRNALLAAATRIFAAKGLTASTASITNEAGCAEGTLFVYFKGKEELINTLYLETKRELAEAMLENYPASSSIYDRIHHVWNGYVTWAVENPEKLSLVHKIKVWECLSPEARDATNAQFDEIHSLTERAIKEQIFADVTEEFVIATLSAQAELTMSFMRKYPEQAAFYRERGFKNFFGTVCRKARSCDKSFNK